MEQTKPCVLITDDSRVVRKAASTILSVNYRVVEAVDGEEALSILASDEHIDAIFLDLWMPGMDGYEVLQQIRKSPDTRLQEIPVIVITGDGEDESIRDKALSLGASDFIGKPFSASQLTASLSSLLEELSADSAVDGAEGLASTKEIKATATSRKLTRREQLVNGGAVLMYRCFGEKQPFSLLKLRIERAGALYHKTGEIFARDSLRQIGLKITHETRRKDFLVRLNVTDFVVVMPRTSALEANEVSNRILRAVRHHVIQYEGSRFHLSMSGGIVTPKLVQETQFDTLLGAADVRLERAISAGGSQNVATGRDISATRNDRMVSLDTATDLLKKGDMVSVQNKVPGLLKKVFPLLVFVNARFKLDIDDALRKIHETTRH